jgi:hypothetical protein
MNELIHRCTCGGWRYEGNTCGTCQALAVRGNNESHRSMEDVSRLQR